jgi:integrase
MAAKRKLVDRALGPYRQSDRYLVVFVPAEATGSKGRKTTPYPFTGPLSEVAALADAQAHVDRINTQAQLAGGVTVEEAIGHYPSWLRAQAEPPSLRSIDTTISQIESFFPVDADVAGKSVHPRHVAVNDLTAAFCEHLYANLKDRPTRFKTPPTGYTLLNTLGAVSRFLTYCVTKKWAAANPLATFKPVVQLAKKGRKGKKQIALDTLPKWAHKGFEMCETKAGDEGAAAALMTLLFGLRVEMIVTLRARNIQFDGALLDLSDTEVNRTKGVPEYLKVKNLRFRPILARLVAGKDPEDWVFPSSGGAGPGRRSFEPALRARIMAEYNDAPKGYKKDVLRKYDINTSLLVQWRRRVGLPALPGPGHRDRSWVTPQIKRVCRAAGVSEKTHAHGMRGAMASLAAAGGDSSIKMQTQIDMGHRPGSAVTDDSYTTAEASHEGQQDVVNRLLLPRPAPLQVLPGGRRIK